MGIYIEKIESNDKRLGRHIEHDDRSFNYKFSATGIKITDVEHKRFIPILNQGQVGACTGFAGIGNINTDPFIKNDNSYYTADDSGALKLYSDAEKIDGGIGYPPEDVGSTGLSIAKALKKKGMISSYQHTFNFNDALKALTKYPIITGIRWYSGMFVTDPDGRVRISGKIVGGHEIEAFKIDIENARVWFYNSWGSQWGINGTFYLTWGDYLRLLEDRGDVTVLIPTIKKPEPIKETYKHFNPKQDPKMIGVSPTLMKILDKMRTIADTPFIITSGVRTPEQNKEVGGVANSAHLKGLAVDLRIVNYNSLTKMLYGISQVRKENPIFLEITKSHLHLDIDVAIHSLSDTIIV